jgi:hypothetical protein
MHHTEMNCDGKILTSAPTNKNASRIISINKLTPHELDPETAGRNNLVLTTIVSPGYSSHPFQVLLDTGASYSVINLNFFNQLVSFGLTNQVQKSNRKKPSSASNHTFDVYGDVVLDLNPCPLK